jgi:hypothetical protein
MVDVTHHRGQAAYTLRGEVRGAMRSGEVKKVSCRACYYPDKLRRKQLLN